MVHRVTRLTVLQSTRSSSPLCLDTLEEAKGIKEEGPVSVKDLIEESKKVGQEIETSKVTDVRFTNEVLYRSSTGPFSSPVEIFLFSLLDGGVPTYSATPDCR